MASRPHRSDAASLVSLLSGPGRSDLARFLIRQRWFAAKARGIGALAVRDWGVLDADGPLVLLLLDVDDDRYYVPVTVAAEGAGGDALARLDALAVIDAHDDPRFGRRLLAAIGAGLTVAGHAGRFRFRSTPALAAPPDLESLPVRRHTGEQSNTSLILGEALVLKSLRRPRPGANPDLEVTRFLTTRTGFRHVPRLAGWAEHDSTDGPATLAVLQERVDNAGDGWSHVVGTLGRRGVHEWPPAAADPLIGELRQLGAITGGLHVALASDATDPDFSPEAITGEDVARWTRSITRDLSADDVAPRLPRSAESSAAASAVVARALAPLQALVGTMKIRGHGDYHLGQVLKTRDGFAIIDFEGEPARPLAERRAKQSALRDVAGMLRSLDYAAHAVARALPEADRPAALATLMGWEARARVAFLDGYREAVTRSPVRLVPDESGALLGACGAFELEKACYELRYELDNRPDWAPIPLAGIGRILLTPERA